MATRTKAKKAFGGDRYMDRVRRFPLKPIRDDDAHARAVGIIAELIGRDVDRGTSDYLDTLIVLVNKYEDEHHTPRAGRLSPREALRAIMSVNGLSQADVGRIIGSESAVSMFLSGERELSKSHIKALATRFRVDASLFL